MYLNLFQAKNCWDKDEFDLSDRKQMATRFYASFLGGNGVDVRTEMRSQYQRDVAPHRYSSDSSVFSSIQKALNKRILDMTQEQLHLLDWNIKHAEYSFGANIEDISMVSAFGSLHSIFKPWVHKLTPYVCVHFIIY